MVSIQYDEETAILKLTYSVSVDLQDVYRFIDHISIDERLPDNLRVLHLAGSQSSTLRMKDLLQISKEMKRGTARFNSVRSAVYTTNPLALTLFQLYERLNVDKNTKFKTFNSNRAAVAWLVEI